MGVSCMSISNSVADVPQAQPNPDPRKFVVDYDMTYVRGTKRYTIAEVRYPDCSTFEGKKILVYENIDSEDLRNATCLDPHFSESDVLIHPIARFVPSSEGMQMARTFVKAMLEV